MKRLTMIGALCGLLLLTPASPAVAVQTNRGIDWTVAWTTVTCSDIIAGLSVDPKAPRGRTFELWFDKGTPHSTMWREWVRPGKTLYAGIDTLWWSGKHSLTVEVWLGGNNYWSVTKWNPRACW